MNDLSEVRESLALKFSAWDGYTDLRYVDTNYSYLHTPSFLNLSQRERDQDPYTFEMLRRSFPYNGPKLLEQPIIYPDTGPHKYRFDCSRWLNQFYPMQCVRTVTDWMTNQTLLIYHLGNGYRISAHCADPITHNETESGYFNLGLIYRPKRYSNLPRTGAREAVEFIRRLSNMPKAPRALFYWPCGKEKMSAVKPNGLEGLDMELVHTTEQLQKIWQRLLGGVQIKALKWGEPSWWVATRYRPKDPAPMPSSQMVTQFEEVIKQYETIKNS